MCIRNHLRLSLVALALALSGCGQGSPITAPKGQDSKSGKQGLESPLIALPSVPTLSPAGEDLILSFEGCDLRPAWPEGDSGLTIGWGYDCGYFSATVIRSDWSALPSGVTKRLAASSGMTGRTAQDYVSRCRDILIQKGIATDVFNRVDVARTWGQCEKAFPEFDSLRANAEASLVSLVYNRGASMIGDSRREMRAIRDLCPKRDYEGMAGQLRAMVRVWRGTSIYNGMYRRRNSEADLMLQR